MAYTSGDTCSNTPISCPTLFDPLPSDEIGSRPSGSCPASRPYQTDKGCCGACRTDQGTVMAYDCGTTCSSSPRPGRFVHSRHLPPQHSSGCLLRSFRWLESQLRWHLCTCHTTGWPFATGLKLECLAQMAATGLDVGLRKDMQVCQDPMSFTPSVMIPLAGWQNGEPGNTVHIPTGVNAPGVGSLDYVITMTGKADNINLTATVDACLLGACTPLLTLVQIKDQSLGTCAPPWAQWAVPLIAIVSVLAVCLLCGGLIYCCCCRRKTARQSDVSGAQLREVTSAAPYDTRLNEAFLSATRPSSQVPIAPLAAINTVPVFGVDGKAMPRYP